MEDEYIRQIKIATEIGRIIVLFLGISLPYFIAWLIGKIKG